MNKLLMPVLGACLLLGACNKSAPDSDAAAAPGESADQASALPATDAAGDTAAPARGPATAAQIDAIKASGKTGLWSDPASACARDNPRAMITWNVADSGADQVVVYLLGKNDAEKVFAQGRAVGQKATGPWLRPGMGFRIRAKDDARELGSLEIAEATDCAPAAE